MRSLDVPRSPRATNRPSELVRGLGDRETGDRASTTGIDSQNPAFRECEDGTFYSAFGIVNGSAFGREGPTSER